MSEPTRETPPSRLRINAWNGYGQRSQEAREQQTHEIPPNPGLMRGRQLMALEYAEERKRAREALLLSLSDESLTSILKELRKFREGKLLPPKVRKILEGVLLESSLQEQIASLRRKSQRQQREGPARE